MKPQAYIIGVGPGSRDLLTDRARQLIQQSQVVMGWDMDLLPAEDILEGKEIYLQDVRNYMEVARSVAEKFRHSEKRVAILRVGDPCISSGLRGLFELFHDYEIQIVPGISSVQMAASLARINIDETVIVTFHESGDIDERKAFMYDALHRRRNLLMLSGEELRPDAAAHYLVERGLDPSLPVIVFEKLTLPGESIVRTTLGELRRMHPFWLSVIAIVQTGCDVPPSEVPQS